MPLPCAPRRSVLAALLAAAAVASACSTNPAPHPGKTFTQRGTASWYGREFDGRPTASGESYDMHRYSAAHRTLPFGSVLEVVNLDNGRTVRVKVNDRGPFVRARVIDVSYAAARDLGLVGPGTARVEVRLVGQAAPVEAPLYLVQAGAFREGERAEALFERLQPRHPDARVGFDGLWHRVEVGPYKKRKKAEAVAAELAQEGVAAWVKAAA